MGEGKPPGETVHNAVLEKAKQRAIERPASYLLYH
jgi:hypothetical protein